MRLIDADELRDEILHNLDEFDNNIVNYYLDVVDSQPTVNAKEEIHAEWVYNNWCEFKCSNCMEKSNSKPYKGREKYCPNCGAKMKKE